jgi:hypothetical protein
MHVCLVNDSAYKAALAPRDWRLLVRNLYSPSGPGAALKTASYVDLSDDNLTAVFVDSGPATGAEGAAQRAARAVAAMTEAASQCTRWVSTHFATLKLPAPRIHIGLHVDAAEVASLPLPTGGVRELVLGAAVDVASGLHRSQPALPWLVCATDAVLAASREAQLFQVAGNATVSVNGQALRLHALTGLGEALGASAWAS